MIETATRTANRFCQRRRIPKTEWEDYQQEAILYLIEHGIKRMACHLQDYHRKQYGIFINGKYNWHTKADLDTLNNCLSHSSNGISSRTAAKDLNHKIIDNITLTDKRFPSGISPTQERNKAIMLEYLTIKPTMKSIGIKHNLSESRISQIIKRTQAEAQAQAANLG